MNNRIKALYQKTASNFSVVRFLIHNFLVWRKLRPPAGCKSEVLFEQTGICPSIVATSYLANALAARHHSKLVAYTFTRPIINAWLNRLYLSCNFETLLHVSPDEDQLARAGMIFEELYPTLKNLHQVERISIGGIWIGDLIYDEYLRQYNVPTIDIADPGFIESLRASLGQYVFWKDYFNEHDVKAVGLSHCVYKLAIPLRLAVNLGIPVYQINATHVYHLTKDNLFAYADYVEYPKIFASLPEKVQSAGILEAQKRIERRLAGEVGVDMKYSKKSAYAGKKAHPVLKRSDRIKILIAPHSFSDSPHSYGINLFPDFYEWLEFLGRISELTHYDWYVKTHPDFLAMDAKVVEMFVKKFPRFTMLPADTSHLQIIEEGINFALTIHGTIGFEYAALGIPVINGSFNNPHAAYDFNIHAKSVDEYRNTLLNLATVKLKINRQEICEYYFMRNLYTTENWLFKDYREAAHLVESASGSSVWYLAWLREWSRARHYEIMADLRDFVKSGESRLRVAHRNVKATDI